MKQNKIAFIGAGNMSRCLIAGLVRQGYEAQNIIAANPSTGKLKALQEDFNIRTSGDNIQAVSAADVVILAVKPQMMAQVCRQLSEMQAPDNHGLESKLWISVAAGVGCKQIKNWLSVAVPLIRCMPNTPALYGKGVCGLYADGTDKKYKTLTETLLRVAGLLVWVEQEQQIDAITAISGSGPAYFFALMEAMTIKAQQLGFDPDTAKQLVQHTAAGAAAMVANSDESIARLRHNVTSKGGTTAAALACFNELGLTTMVDDAMQAAYDRAQTLGKNL